MVLIILLVLGFILPPVMAWFFRGKTGTQLAIYLGTLLAIGLPALILGIHLRNQANFSELGMMGVIPAMFLIGLTGILLLAGLIEFGVLRLLGLTSLGAIARVTYYEALLQPFTLIVLAGGVFAIVIFGFVPFFTLNEDSKMYRDVTTSFAFMFVMPILIFASSKVVDEEIENRTMLTLMSKPVSRWQVVIGKYTGVLLLILVCTFALGTMAGVSSFARYFDDQRMDYFVAGSQADIAKLDSDNHKTLLALVPANILQFMQLATLAAVSVAISTRFGLALNVTVIVLMYMLSNLARYVDLLQLTQPWEGIVKFGAKLLPSLGLLDINQRLIYGNYNLGKEMIVGLPGYDQIWGYVGQSGLYTVLYIGAALCLAVGLFRTRELS